MKKSLIATGVASLALAAMPLAGSVFADPTTSTMTDTLNVTIPPACTIRNSLTQGDATTTENVYNVTMKNGQLRSDIGDSAVDGGEHDNNIIVNCNIQTGNDANWSLSVGGKGNTNVLSNGTPANNIATGTNTSGNSSWAFKTATATAGVTYAQGYSSGAFAEVPANPATLATGTGNASFTMNYQVYISATQATGNYTGGVVYTLTNPAT